MRSEQNVKSLLSDHGFPSAKKKKKEFESKGEKQQIQRNKNENQSEKKLASFPQQGGLKMRITHLACLQFHSWNKLKHASDKLVNPWLNR